MYKSLVELVQFTDTEKKYSSVLIRYLQSLHGNCYVKNPEFSRLV